jgi:formate-dependent nitrite reductase membrane component NrfD
MLKLMSAVTLFLMSSPLFAAAKEMEAAAPPSEPVDMVWVVVFGVIFVGMIIAFFAYLWYTEKNRKAE